MLVYGISLCSWEHSFEIVWWTLLRIMNIPGANNCDTHICMYIKSCSTLIFHSPYICVHLLSCICARVELFVYYARARIIILGSPKGRLNVLRNLRSHPYLICTTKLCALARCSSALMSYNIPIPLYICSQSMVYHIKSSAAQGTCV